METQVKERLTGAVILVTLVVLLVPELLSGPETGRAEPSSAAGEPAMRSYTIDLLDGGVRPDTRPAATAQSARPKPQGQQEVDGREPAAEATAPQEEESLEAAVVTQPEQASAPRQPADAAAVSPPVAAPQPAAVADREGGWDVQLGSFASRENAQRLARELKAKGFAAFVLDGGGKSGTLYRVRVGPEPDRATATALAAKLRAAGRPGAVVEHP